MALFTIERRVAAPPQTVFEVITDHRAYPDYTPLRKAILEKEGTPVPNGVGAVRALYLVGPPMREEVIAYQAPRSFTYRLISGLPVRDHLGIVVLTPDGEGTKLAYEIQTTPTIRPLAPLIVAVLKISIGRLVAGVAKEAERRSPS
ncbi:MAG: SRPBCC family protein [Solirubrobacterales bacterium]